MQVPVKGSGPRFLRRKRTVYFVHPPKTGGSYIEAVFGKRRRRACPTQTLPAARGHRTWAEYKSALEAAGIDFTGHFIFATVRNPWDWQVSFYHYIRQNPSASGYKAEGELMQRLSFADYLQWLNDVDGDQRMQMTMQISDWITDPSTGNIVVDRILRQESLEDDLRTMAADLAIDISIKSTLVNASQRERDYRPYYTDTTAEIVAQRHRRDIELFGYAFDQGLA